MSMAARMALCSAVLVTGCWAQPMAGGQLPEPKGSLQKAGGQDASASNKQEELQSPLRLTQVETVLAKKEVANLVGDLTCDEDGNIYLETGNPGGPIRELNPKGETVADFLFSADTSIDVYGNGPYTLSADGALYTWVGNKKDGQFYVLVFGADGTHKRSIKLDPGFPWVPGPFAVFSNGNFLMTGQEYDRDVRKPMLPFTAIFRSDGKLLKEISFEDDERIHKMTLERDPVITSAMAPNDNRAVAFGHVQPAKDGNLYVMRWMSPAVIYVVSPGGEVLRRFTVDPGDDKMMPLQMFLSENRIAMLFRNGGTRAQIMKVVDLTGKELATYDAVGTDPKAPLGAAFACYSGKTERFSFLSSDDDHRLLIRITEPR
ncbi:MAG TPA: hypothetical protein VJW20_22820 [Candidatus Angelobacter sp.]|nr:hypothetical protein [Candidatus Angelobacter sp.]